MLKRFVSIGLILSLIVPFGLSAGYVPEAAADPLAPDDAEFELVQSEGAFTAAPEMDSFITSFEPSDDLDGLSDSNDDPASDLDGLSDSNDDPTSDYDDGLAGLDGLTDDLDITIDPAADVYVMSSSAPDNIPASIDDLLPESTLSPWAYAATAAMQIAGRIKGNVTTNTPIPLPNPFFTLTNPGANRAGLTAGLMRNTASRQQNEVTPLLGGKTMYPVSGVVHIPNIAATAAESVRETYRNRIKNAIESNGAVAASLYYDAGRFQYATTAASDETHIYDNVSRRLQTAFVFDPAITIATNTSIISALNRDANHSLVIVGWDDNVELTYKVDRTVGDIIVPVPLTIKGAWIVYDNLRDGARFWVSYDNPLTDAYYIDGFYQSETSFPLVTQRKNAQGEDIKKNPLAHTYEYDASGFTGVFNVAGNAIYANVFNSERATAVHAVSVFLTAEGAAADIFIINDYKDDKCLDRYRTDYSPAADRVTRSAALETTLPGYYTVKLDVPVEITHGRFAVVVVTTGGGNVPVQRSGAPSSSNGWFRDGDGTDGTWRRINNQAVCIKAHAETGVDINLQGIEILGPESTKTSLTEPLVVAPGSSHPIGPTFIPTNANDVDVRDTKWSIQWTYYKRHTNPVRPEFGFLELDNDGNLITGYGWLTWNESWGMFVPTTTTSLTDAYPEARPSGVPANRLDFAWDPAAGGGNGAATKHDDYVVQPLRIQSHISGNARLQVSNDRAFYDYSTPISLRVAVTTRGVDDEGKFIPGDAGVKNPPGLTTFIDGNRGTHSFITAINIEAEAVDKLEISRRDLTMRAGATANLAVRQLDKDGRVLPPREVIWRVEPQVVNDPDQLGTATGFAPYDPRDPFNPNGPPAIVDRNGRVSALRGDVIVFVYATVGGITSEPCRVVITRQATTGVTVNRRKQTMSVDTTFSITANVRPAGASNRRIIWSIKPGEPEDIVAIDQNRLGIITALKPGRTILVARNCVCDKDVCDETCNSTHRAESEITVVSSPSATVRLGRSGNYTVLGTPRGSRVNWYVSTVTKRYDEVSSPTSIDKLTSPQPFEATVRNLGVRMTATTVEANVGAIRLIGEVMAPDPTDPDNRDKDTPVRIQSWNLEAVVPISRMVITQERTDTNQEIVPIRRLIFTVDSSPNARNGQEANLEAVITRPEPAANSTVSPATMLRFDWTQRLPRNVTDPFFEIETSGDNQEKVKLTALRPGNTRLTGTNHNGRRRVTLSVRILINPTAGQIRPRASSLENLKLGRTVSVKARVNGRGLNPELTYTLEDVVPAGAVTLNASRPGRPTDRLAAVSEGTATLVITGSGQGGPGTGASVRVPIKVE
jgi:hypothetical protein